MSQMQIQDISFYRDQLNKAVQEGKISNWELHTIKKRRNNIYIEKEYRIESLLESKREELVFSIYKEYDDELGEASFTLNEADSKEVFEQEFKDALFICSQGKSKKYALPKKNDKTVEDSHIKYDSYYSKEFFKDFESKQLPLRIAKELETFKKLIEEANNAEIKITLNSFEFHTTLLEKKFESSEKIIKEAKSNAAYMDFVLTGKKGKDEVEHILYEKIPDIYSFDFESFFKEQISHTRNKVLAKMSSEFKGIIVLKDISAFDFFVPEPPTNSAVVHASARLKFFKISQYEVGKPICNAKKDTLTLYSNSLISNGAASPYDEHGISAKKTLLIEDGVFKQFFASKQYAHYLGIEPTGPLGVIEVEGGEKTLKELLNEKKFIEIINFAWFNPDLVSGDFSAEIRLGYLHKDGQKIPFKGGLFTGNIFKLLENVEFSKERIEEVGYLGPKVIKFYEGEIVGL